MGITFENLLYHEISGLSVAITESSDETLRGITGVIVSETKNTFFVRKSGGKTIQIAKQVARKIQLGTDEGVCFISGSSLIGKPEDRTARLN